MSAVMNHQVVEAVARPAVRPEVAAPARENKPVAGVITIRLAFTPGLVMLLSAPVAVGVVMALGWVVRTSFSMPLYGHEMIAGGIVNVIGGLVAAVPILIFMKKGVIAIVQATMLSMVLRCGVILMGLMLAFGPGWQLAKMPLAVWTLCCYFPLLIVETACIAWMSQKSPN